VNTKQKQGSVEKGSGQCLKKFMLPAKNVVDIGMFIWTNPCASGAGSWAGIHLQFDFVLILSSIFESSNQSVFCSHLCIPLNEVA